MKPPIAATKPYRQEHHGVVIEDPYNWIRDSGYPEVNNPDVLAYLEAENAYFDSEMAPQAGLTEAIFEEIKGRMPGKDEGVPWRDGGYYYQWRFEAGGEYRIWSRYPASEGDNPQHIETMLDEAAEAEGHDYYAVADQSVSPCGRLHAWSVDTSGAERYTIRVKELASGEPLDDVVAETHGEIVWDAAGAGFFYTRVNKEWRPFQVWYHPLGGDEHLIYEEDEPSFFVGVRASQSREFLIIGTGDHVTSEVRFLRLVEPLSEPTLIRPRTAAHEYHVDHNAGRFVIRTNDAHRNFRIVSAAPEHPQDWTELLPAGDSRYVTGCVPFANFLVISQRIEGLEGLTIRSWDGDTHDIEFPEKVCTLMIGANAEPDQAHVRLVYQSMITPSTTYDYDVASRSLKLRKQQEIPSGYDKSGYETTRLMATARDGAQVPVSVVYPKDYPRDGSGKLHLYGYGAYGLAMHPSFSAARLSLLDRGFAYAIAHIRGGDEMGYHWYEDGKLDKRTNTFNDFVDAARCLIDEGWARAGNISISGGSAGGELMGAVTLQAPELWRAVVLHVPFVDVLNTMLDGSLPLTPIEWPEWGNPIENKADFDNIASYSPYDNIEKRDYPWQMVTGGLNDPRVTYWEPAKWTAKMRAMKTDDNPLVMKINMGAGHGGKTGRYQQVQETAEEYTFVLKAFGAN